MTSLVRAYESLLLSNLSTARTLESILRNVTWFLPGRFEDAELASEGVYALLNVVSGYHDTLLSRRIDSSLSLPPHPFAKNPSQLTVNGVQSGPRLAPLLPPPSEHARYTRYWTHRSAVYRRASRSLVTITYVELLVEMVARKRGLSTRWRLVFFIECIKTTLRLILLSITRRPVLSPPTPQREYELSLLTADILDGTQTSSSNSALPPVVTTIEPHAPLRNHLYPMAGALPESYLPLPLTLVPELDSTSAWTSEILSSIATLLHVILLIRASRNQNPNYRSLSLPTLSRSLPPFLIPLVMQIAAHQLRSSPNTSLLLTSHYAHLDRNTAKHFFLTGPMWVGWTRPKVMSVVKGLERIPMVGLVGELVEGYLPLVDDYFYCRLPEGILADIRHLVMMPNGEHQGGKGTSREEA